jgi:hypothetical protein
MADWDSLDIPLKPLRDRARVVEADSALTRLRRLTAKPLTMKNPTMPTADAVADWAELRRLLIEIAECNLGSETRTVVSGSR